MKTLLACFSLWLCLPFIGSANEYKPFTAIEVSGAYEIIVIQGDIHDVMPEGDKDLIANTDVKVKGHTLYIESNKEWADDESLWTTMFKSDNKGKARVRIKIILPVLEEIVFAGASYGTVSNFETEDLTVNISGAARLTVNVKANHIIAGVAGASVLVLKGSCKELRADIAGAARLRAMTLISNRANVKASGASKADVWISDTLEANAAGASSIIYGGTPGQIRKNATGVSRVEAQ